MAGHLARAVRRRRPLGRWATLQSAHSHIEQVECDIGCEATNLMWHRICKKFQGQHRL